MVRARLVNEQKPDVELLLTWDEASNLVAEIWEKIPLVRGTTARLIYDSLISSGVPNALGKV